MKLNEDSAAIQLFTEIGIIDQLVSHQLERSLPDGLKMSQFGVLNHFVRLGGEWSPARLASAFQVTKAAMTNTLSRLEKRNLVCVKGDPNDGRAKIVTITPAGHKMREQCVKNISPFLAELSQEISEKDFATALPVLAKVRSFLDSHRS